MSKNTSILLGDYFENFIQEEIAKGKYSSVSELVRTALRILEVEEIKKRQLNSELILGENSAMLTNYNAELHLKELRTSKL